MPKNKFQDAVFTVIMVIVMVYAMVCYNISTNMGGLSNEVFLMALKELPLMGVIAFILEFFLIGKLAQKIALKLLDPKDYEDTKYVINQLGYIEYVSFKKYRQVYSKNINGFEYNIMIDKIDGVGNFIELEILANTEEEKEKLRTELDKFVERMNCNKLKEKEKPYRDIVKEHMDRKK